MSTNTTSPNAHDVLLAALGCPTPEATMLHRQGVNAFVRSWAEREPGTTVELSAILQLLDPSMTLTADELAGAVWPTECPTAQVVLGIAPRRRLLDVTLHWTRSDLLRQPTFAAWVDAVVAWWLPLNYDGFHVQHHWGPTLAVACEPLATRPAPPCFGRAEAIYYRRVQAPATTVLAVVGTAKVREAGQFVVGDDSLQRFLANVAPFVPVWKPRARTSSATDDVVWETQQRTRQLWVLTDPPTAPLRWTIAGHVRRPESTSRPGVFVFTFDETLAAGATVTLQCRTSEGEPVGVYPNPVVFQSVAPPSRAASDSLSYESIAGSHSAAAPHRYETMLAGCHGMERVWQPWPLQPTLLDRRLACQRRADLERLLARLFLGISEVRCDLETRWNPAREACPQRYVVVTCRRRDAALPVAQLRQAFLQTLCQRLPKTLAVSITFEESNDEALNTDQSPATRSRVRGSVAPQGTRPCVSRAGSRKSRRTARRPS